MDNLLNKIPVFVINYDDYVQHKNNSLKAWGISKRNPL